MKSRKSNPSYQHLQIGYALLAMISLAEISMLATCIRYGKGMAAAFFSLLLLFLGACFFSLRVRVEENFLELRFGMGLIRKVIPLEEIQSFTPIRNSVLSGWGIRQFKRGMVWLYNVSGFDAVELHLKNGQAIRIGTDDPAGLLKALYYRTPSRGRC